MKLCENCSSIVSRPEYIHCRKCHNLLGLNGKNRRKERPNCKDCGKKLISLKSQRCKSCNNSHRWRNKEYKFRVGKMISSSNKGKKRLLHSLNIMGSKNPAWKGGVKPLMALIRNLSQYHDWKRKIIKRDKNYCLECNNIFNENEIEVHHPTTFSFLYKGFLNKYSQFSPIEDKETLVRLAIYYEPFWDIKNGVSLCVDCHKKLTKQERCGELWPKH